jgi:hypothetical protein
MNVKVFGSKQSCQFTGNIWELRWTDRKITKNLIIVTVLGQDLNQEHPKYESQPLLFELICLERLRSCSYWGGGILKGLTCFMIPTLVGLPY